MKNNLPAPAALNRDQCAIQLDNIVKAFGPPKAQTVALRDASFKAPLGELTMIVGPSGCGKTTLLSIMAGTLLADSGTVGVLGYSLEKFDQSKLTQFRATHVGFIFQQFNLIGTLSILENVSIPLIINGTKASEAEQRAAELISKVGLKGRERDVPSKLSGGQQQRVAIARAMIHNPPLLICDEPTSALDRENGREIMEMIRQIAREPNRCVIVVSHDARVYSYADRISEMEDGRIVRVYESPAAIKASHLMS